MSKSCQWLMSEVHELSGVTFASRTKITYAAFRPTTIFQDEAVLQSSL